MKTVKPTINKQRQALERVCKIYWDEFKDAELKHEKVSEKLTVYSLGKNYIHFYPITPCGWSDLGLNTSNMTFVATEITEKTFYSALKFIKKELLAKVVKPEDRKIAAIKALKAEVKTKREELKRLESL